MFQVICMTIARSMMLSLDQFHTNKRGPIYRTTDLVDLGGSSTLTHRLVMLHVDQRRHKAALARAVAKNDRKHIGEGEMNRSG